MQNAENGCQASKNGTTPLLMEVHKQSRLHRANDYIKTDLYAVVCTDECRTTLDGPGLMSGGVKVGWLQVGRDCDRRTCRPMVNS